MLYGVIDLGSNTIRLTAYRVEKKSFKILFNQKTMAGLAGYVDNKKLTKKGIDTACDVLNQYKSIMQNFDMDKLLVFATASLRNIENTEEAVGKILIETGLDIEILSGEEEASLDFEGATHNLNMDKGILVDIGGGSTELVTYGDNKMITPVSLPIGSLYLYKNYVETILPKKSEIAKMEKKVTKELEKNTKIEKKTYSIICGVGGTIRALLKLNNYMFGLPHTNNIITTENLNHISTTLNGSDSSVWNLILKICPDRIHTIIPGLQIIKTTAKYYNSEKIIVSSYGVREGYLYNRIINAQN